MILSLQEQGRLFLLTILMGGTLGLIYDCLRVFRRIVRHNTLWLQLEDGLFWLAAVFLVFGVMLRANGGEIRFFCIFGLFGGMGIYFLTVSRIVIAVSDRIIYVVKRAILLLLQIIMTPFRLVYLLLRKPMAKAAVYCGRMRKKVLHSFGIYAKIKLHSLNRDWRMAVRQKCRNGEKLDEKKNRRRKHLQKKQKDKAS